MFAVILLAALLSGEPASEAKPAAARAGEVTAARAQSAKAGSDRVCKLEPVLGSKITKKVCYSREQMAERTFYDKQNLDLIQNATPMNSR